MVLKVTFTKADKTKIYQTHDVNSWHMFVNAVYPSLVEHDPVSVIIHKPKKKGTRFV